MIRKTFFPRRRKKAMALVVVLCCLVILSVLIVAFLVNVGTELQSSKSYAEGSSARILAQSAVNLVAAEIRDATHSYDSNGKLGTWASQPGMIRTYKNDGNPDHYFKLYSDLNMIGDGVFDAGKAAVQMTNWSADSAIYTDLNQPVTVGGVSHYPILDGNQLVTLNGVKTYDSDGNGVADVEGFSIKTNAPIASTGTMINPVPMPVRWLYVLADGTIVPPSGSGTTAVVTGASSSNPIVGRIAFWTDDETAKVNINTASEGSYWDTPRFCSKSSDTPLADNQPAQREYQRYPGHPATTSLSKVFGPLAVQNSYPENLYPMTPRYMSGGSKSGTVAPTSPLVPSSTTPGTGNNRLYATIDEFIFQPDRLENSPLIDKRALEQAKFFLTANSRAPDLNLFGKPRVCAWPVFKGEDLTRTTAFDRLIAFCSTFNGMPYFFQRENSSSPTNDLPESGELPGLGRNRMLLEYLRNLTSQDIPGFGGRFETKYGTQDRDQILTEIFDYIRCLNLVDSTLPNAADTFTPSVDNPKTGLREPTVGGGQVVPIEDTKSGTRGFGRFPTLQGLAFLFVGVADKNNPAPNTGSTPPDGRIKVQALMVPQLFDPSQGYVTYWPNFKIKMSWKAGDLLWSGVNESGNSTAPQPIFPVSSNGAILKVSGGSGQTGYNPMNIVGDKAYGGIIGAFEVAAKQVMDHANSQLYPWATTAPNAIMMMHPNPPAPSIPPATPPSFDFSGGVVTVTFLAPDGTELQSIEVTFPAGKFPVPDIAPTNIKGYNTTYDFRFLTYSDRTKGFASSESLPRLGAIATWGSVPWITTKDVVRSIVPAVGDMRMIAPRKTITTNTAGYDTYFKAHSLYTSGEQWAHNLRFGSGEPYFRATRGRLLKLPYWNNGGLSGDQYTTGSELSGANVNWPTDSGLVPDTFSEGVALGKTTSASAGDLNGDWDNGVGYVADGPYINKADEGDGDTAVKPYYGFNVSVPQPTIFSPNRMMPSPGMFGSLPSGVWANRPWQTLLFRHDPTGRHPGGKNRKGDGQAAQGMPADHLLLDLFHMPVVEPYAISEPLSTAGRINMNYQIVPFLWINRNTGIRAVLKPEKVISVPDSASNTYKRYAKPDNTSASFRHDVNADETLKGFEERFSGNEIFRSPTEICELPIVPMGATYAGMSTYWDDKRLTGDNSRERPYSTIYPRITTKSNTYTVHFRVQTLKKKKNDADQDQWKEGKDLIASEYRGSQTLERYIDPNDPSLPDFADPSTTGTIDSFYRFRVVTAKQFAP